MPSPSLTTPTRTQTQPPDLRVPDHDGSRSYACLHCGATWFSVRIGSRCESPAVSRHTTIAAQDEPGEPHQHQPQLPLAHGPLTGRLSSHGSSHPVMRWQAWSLCIRSTHEVSSILPFIPLASQNLARLRSCKARTRACGPSTLPEPAVIGRKQGLQGFLRPTSTPCACSDDPVPGPQTLETMTTGTWAA